MGCLEDDIEDALAKLKNAEGREDFLLDDVGKEGADDFVVNMVPAAEDVLGEGEGLLDEHDEEKGELEAAELVFVFDKMVTGLFDHLLEVVFHLFVADKFKVEWIQNGVAWVVVFA